MDTAITHKFPFILDRNLAKANCTGNHVCTSCDTVVLGTRVSQQRIENNDSLLGSNKKLEMLSVLYNPFPHTVFINNLFTYPPMIVQLRNIGFQFWSSKAAGSGRKNE